MITDKNIISKHYNSIKYQDHFVPLKNFNDSKNIFIVGLPRSGSSLVETIICHNTNNIHTFGEFHGINTSILNQISKKIYYANRQHFITAATHHFGPTIAVPTKDVAGDFSFLISRNCDLPRPAEE